MAVASGPNAEVIGGVPLIGVIGTPRTMGGHLGSRLKPRLQVLSQYLTDQLCTHAKPGGHSITPEGLHRMLEPSQELIQRHEPSLWMELEAMAHAAELPISDLLIIHGYNDLLSRLSCEVAPLPSTYVNIDATHTADGAPLMAMCWYLDPALFPYLTLLRRIPTHGPSTLSLTLAGLGHIAGLSEAGIAVARNELRVNDGVDGLFTSHMLAAMLSAPSFDDVQKRAHAGPRQGGAAIHGLSAKGERFTSELSGQQEVRLNDPFITSPRVHTNHALDNNIQSMVSKVEKTSKIRLEQMARHIVETNGVTSEMIAGWFGFDNPAPKTSRIEADSERVPISYVFIALDPYHRQVYLRRTGVPTTLETIKL